MRTFAQKQNQPQKSVSSSLARSNTAAPGLHHRAALILHLQRTIGNQAVLRMLQTHAEEPDVGLIAAASPRFGHDFSQIPLYPPVAGAIQTKLAINKPGDDEYEQEADRISAHVMRMPEPELQRACPCGGGCPKCQAEQPDQEHESLQAKRIGSSDLEQTAVPPIAHDVLRSPGQPLDAATRAFMEPRFGHDFSRVRVHRDNQAAKSAQAVNAIAYTVGQDVVFGPGQYAPETASGRLLLAHELVHTLQQQHHRQVQRSGEEDNNLEQQGQDAIQAPIPFCMKGCTLSEISWGESSSIYPTKDTSAPPDLYNTENWDKGKLHELLKARHAMHVIGEQRNPDVARGTPKPKDTIEQKMVPYHFIQNFPPLDREITDTDVKYFFHSPQSTAIHPRIYKGDPSRQELVKTYGPFFNSFSGHPPKTVPRGPVYLLFYKEKLPPPP